jgi:uncharacterized DUF497 family protein
MEDPYALTKQAGAVIRLISARPAIARERRQYEAQK